MGFEGVKGFGDLIEKKEPKIVVTDKFFGLDKESFKKLFSNDGTFPPLSKIISHKTDSSMRIGDIATFIGIPEEPLLAHLSKQFLFKNVVHISAEVNLAQVVKVGKSILEASRLVMPIMVAKISDGIHKGEYHCWSGRHRLAFLALIYGIDESIPVIVESMTLEKARQNVIYANQSRKIQSLEKIDHRIAKNNNGKINAERDELYAKVHNKSGAIHFAVFSVFNLGMYGMNIDFSYSTSPGVRGKAITTAGNLIKFFQSALSWNKNMKMNEFDSQIKSIVKFLNELVEKLKTSPNFDPSRLLSEKALIATGKLYRNSIDVIGSIDLDKVFESLVGLNPSGATNSEMIYESLVSRMRQDK